MTSIWPSSFIQTRSYPGLFRPLSFLLTALSLLTAVREHPSTPANGTRDDRGAGRVRYDRPDLPAPHLSFRACFLAGSGCSRERHAGLFAQGLSREDTVPR